MLVTTDAVKRYDPHMQRMACFAFLLSRIDLAIRFIHVSPMVLVTRLCHVTIGDNRIRTA